MGLELLELELDVEERFGIEISDEEAAVIGSPRQLVDFIEGRIEATSEVDCLSQRAFYRLRKAMVSAGVASRAEFSPASDLEPYFPSKGRRERWREIGEVLSIPLPDLRRSGLVLAAAGLLASSMAVAAFSVGGVPGSVMALLVSSFLLSIATRPLGSRLPVATAGELARRLAQTAPSHFLEHGERPNRREIEEIVYGLVRESSRSGSCDPDGDWSVNGMG